MIRKFENCEWAGRGCEGSKVGISVEGMGKLTNAHKLTARTSPEVVEGVGALLARRPFTAYKFLGRKLGIEGLLGAVMLEFLDRPECDQVAVLDSWLSELEEQVRRGDPAQKHGPESVRMPPPPITGELTPVDRPREPSPGAITGELTPVKRKGRKKSG